MGGGVWWFVPRRIPPASLLPPPNYGKTEFVLAENEITNGHILRSTQETFQGLEVLTFTKLFLTTGGD